MNKSQTKQLNDLIKAGKTAEAAAFLLSLDQPQEKKKRGRPKKVVEPEILHEVKINPAPQKQLAPNTVSTKSTKAPEPVTVVGKDGKQHTRSREVGWSPPEKIVFADYGVASQKLNYPAPTQRRPPVEKIGLQCKGCNQLFEVYPSEAYGVTGTEEGKTFKCNRCSVSGG